MIDTQENKVCPICRRPKGGGASGRITQWISTCRCDIQESESDGPDKLQICADCRKRVNPARGGSITQWIFSENFCKCENPRLVSVGIDEINSGPDGSQGDTSEVYVDETYLEVDPSEFPVERYKPLKFLGRGALGEVYLCRDAYLRKKVAVKCLLNLTADCVVAFQNEAKIASKLNHESVISVMDFGTTEGGRPFMVMEYFPGKSLQEIIAESGKIDEVDTIELFAPVCSSLQYLHESGVLHRDLKPSNILVSVSASGAIDVRLIDFGLSKTTQDVQSKTLVDGHTIVGTPGYMSPDQVQGQAYDVKSEVYSLGCVMFEAVTGRQPFDGDTPLKILNNHVNQPVPSVSKLEPEVSVELCELIETCLSKSRRDRYASIREVEEVLAMCRQERSSAPSHLDSPVHLEYETFLPLQSSRKNWILIAAPAVVLVALLSVMMWRLLEPSASSSVLNSRIRYYQDREMSIASVSKEGTALKSDPRDPSLMLDGGPATESLKAAALERADRQTVSLTACEVVDGDVSIIASMQPRTLKVSDCTGITDERLAELAKVTSLESLRLSGCKQITPKGIRHFARARLHHLEMSDCELTDQHLAAMQSMKNVRSLILLLNDKITLAGINQLHNKSVITDNAKFANLSKEEIDRLRKNKVILYVYTRSGASIVVGAPGSVAPARYRGK